jgi:hypothetical protein
MGDCRSGGRLCRLAGWTPREYLRRLDRTNVVREPIPPGGGFPLRRARLGALSILGALQRDRHSGLVLLGRNVQRSFAWRRPVGFLEWGEVLTADGSWRAIVVPHPSGRNRWWNEEPNRAAVRDLFNDLKEGATT